MVAAKQSTETDSVAEGEDGRIEGNGQPPLLGIDKGLAGSEAHFSVQLSRTEGGEVDIASGSIMLSFQPKGGLHAVIGLIFEGELLTIVKHHPLDTGPLKSSKDVVLVGVEESVAGRHNIVRRRESQRTLGVLAGQIVLLVQRPYEITTIIGFV